MQGTKNGTLVMTLFGAVAILGTIGLRSVIALGLLCLFGVLSPVYALASLFLIPIIGSAVAVARYRSAIRKSPEGEIEITARIERNGLIHFARDGEAGA
jgi:uncharacterized protein (DUF983 family)